MTDPTDAESPQRRFARRTWAGLGIEGELAFASALAALYPDGIPDEPDLDAVERVATLFRDGVEPVGLAEIAERLGVQRDTVDQWRTRDLLPEPRWTVGGRPAWAWADIEEWARATGRL